MKTELEPGELLALVQAIKLVQERKLLVAEVTLPLYATTILDRALKRLDGRVQEYFEGRPEWAEWGGDYRREYVDGVVAAIDK